MADMSPHPMRDRFKGSSTVKAGKDRHFDDGKTGRGYSGAEVAYAKGTVGNQKSAATLSHASVSKPNKTTIQKAPQTGGPSIGYPATGGPHMKGLTGGHGPTTSGPRAKTGSKNSGNPTGGAATGGANKMPKGSKMGKGVTSGKKTMTTGHM